MAKRLQFGSRFLKDTRNVFEHNAWDNVVWDAEQEADARTKVANNSKVKMADETKEEFEIKAGHFWDKFYMQHQNRFFKDRHWLFTEFPELSPSELRDTFPKKLTSEKQNNIDTPKESAIYASSLQDNRSDKSRDENTDTDSGVIKANLTDTPAEPAVIEVSQCAPNLTDTPAEPAVIEVSQCAPNLTDTPAEPAVIEVSQCAPNLTDTPAEPAAIEDSQCAPNLTDTPAVIEVSQCAPNRTDTTYPGHHAHTRLLEVGCGVGNTVFPVLQTNNDPGLFIYCCDLSPVAVDLVKNHTDYTTERCHPFVCDVTDPKANMPFPEGSLDFIIFIFILSAVLPEKMQNTISNLVKYLKPGGKILFRDYGRYDLAQLRFKEGSCIDENFYARGDGTRVYFFTQEELRDMFTKAGLEEEQNYIDRRLQVNRGKQIKMYRKTMGSMDKEEQHRLRSLLVNALTVICRSSLGYRHKFTVEGLLGITLDEQDIILVNVNELVHKDTEPLLDKDAVLEDYNRSKPLTGERKSRKRRSPRKTVSTWDSPLSPDSNSESDLFHADPSSLSIKGEPGDEEDGGYGKMPRIIAPTPPGGPSSTQTHDEDPLDLTDDLLERSKSRDNRRDSMQSSATHNSLDVVGRLLSTSSEEGSTSQASNQDVISRTPNFNRPRFPNQAPLNAGLMNIAANMVAMATRSPWEQKLPPFQSLLEVKKENPVSAGLNIAIQDGRRQVTCKGCGQTFRLQRELVNHAIMTRCRNFTCSHCGKDFVRPEYLYQHIRVKHTEPKYRCTYCGHKSATKQNLLLHMNVHENQGGMTPRRYPGSPRGAGMSGMDRGPGIGSPRGYNGDFPPETPRSYRSQSSESPSLQSPLQSPIKSPDMCSPKNLSMSPRDAQTSTQRIQTPNQLQSNTQRIQKTTQLQGNTDTQADMSQQRAERANNEITQSNTQTLRHTPTPTQITQSNTQALRHTPTPTQLTQSNTQALRHTPTPNQQPQSPKPALKSPPTIPSPDFMDHASPMQTSQSLQLPLEPMSLTSIQSSLGSMQTTIGSMLSNQSGLPSASNLLSSQSSLPSSQLLPSLSNSSMLPNIFSSGSDAQSLQRITPSEAQAALQRIVSSEAQALQRMVTSASEAQALQRMVSSASDAQVLHRAASSEAQALQRMVSSDAQALHRIASSVLQSPNFISQMSAPHTLPSDLPSLSSGALPSLASSLPNLHMSFDSHFDRDDDNMQLQLSNLPSSLAQLPLHHMNSITRANEDIDHPSSSSMQMNPNSSSIFTRPNFPDGLP